MKKSVKIVSGILGFMMLMPGLAKFTEPFSAFIYQHLVIIGFPFPEFMQYAVKFGEIGIGLTLLFLAFASHKLSKALRNRVFVLANLAVVATMVVAIYTHLHPDVPAEILPLEYKPPVMGFSYIVLAGINLSLNKKNKK